MAEMIVDQRECVRKVTNSNIHPVCSDISRVKGLLRVLGTATCCLLVLALLPAPPASAGYVVDGFDKYAGRSRTYLADKDDTGSIFEVRFTASQPGEQRRLRGQLELIAPKSISDDMVVARHASLRRPQHPARTDLHPETALDVHATAAGRAPRPPVERRRLRGQLELIAPKSVPDDMVVARHAILRRPQHPARTDLHPETALDVHGTGAGRVPLLPVAGHRASPPVGQEDLVEHPQ